MRKIIVEFELPEDQDSFDTYTQAYRFHAVLTDLLDEFRSKIKYSKHNKTDIYWRDRLQALLDERDVKL